jgi:hypothetical protein
VITTAQTVVLLVPAAGTAGVVVVAEAVVMGIGLLESEIVSGN